MQTDMHYYGTYCLARSAGLNGNTAQAIATAAEYVDDSGDISSVILKDGAMLKARATAHHAVNGDNLDLTSQREIWVPFHFLPGNEGESLEQRLLCQKNSKLAQEMVAHHLNLSTQEYGPELIGITAHVYADTFSHYGFSGISSDHNTVNGSTINLRVRDDGIRSYIEQKFEAFKEKYVTNNIANLVSLGHGSVGTYPDRPYLNWDFTYELTGRSSGERDNPATFLEACKSLYEMFSDYAERMPELNDGNGKPFEQIEPELAKILATEGTMEHRIQTWQASAESAALYSNDGADLIPPYNPEYFSMDTERLQDFDSQTMHSTTFFSFLQAAKIHRDYVLNELLPGHGIYIIYQL